MGWGVQSSAQCLQPLYTNFQGMDYCQLSLYDSLNIIVLPSVTASVYSTLMANSNCMKTSQQLTENYQKTMYVQVVSQSQNGNLLAPIRVANVC